MIDRQDDFRHGGRGHGFDETRTRANDAGMFSLSAHHESGHVLDKKQRRAMTIASLNKVSDLLGRFSVNDSAKLRRAARGIAKHAPRVCDHAHLNSAETRMTGDDLFRIVGLKLVKMPVINQTVQQLAHVVRLAMILGKDLVDIFGQALSAEARGWRLEAGGWTCPSL